MAETVSQIEKVRYMMQRFIAVAALVVLFIAFFFFKQKTAYEI